MHNLLKRQLRHHFGDAPPSAEEWPAFLAAVDAAYQQFDRDRGLLERVLELSAQDVLEANSKLRAVFDAFPDGCLRLDAGGKVLDYTVGRTTRLQLAEPVLGQPLREVLPWADGAALEAALRRVRETNEIVGVELARREADAEHDYEARLAPLLDDQTFVVIRDVSERRRAEAELRARARQQAAVAALGKRGLAAGDVLALLEEAVALIAETLGVEHSTVWELEPDGLALVRRAGVGWSQRTGVPRRVAIEPGLAMHAGVSPEPVVVEDYRTETRFPIPALVHEHGLVSGMTVLIRDRAGPFGFLSAHTNRRRVFTRDDVHFLQAA